MANFTKTGVDLITHQAATHPTSIIGGQKLIPTEISAFIVCYLGYVEGSGTANTNPPSFLIQGHPEEGTNVDGWATLVKFTSAITTVEGEAISSILTNDTTTSVVHSFTETRNEGKPLYFQDTASVTNGEWHYCQDILDTTSVFTFDNPTGSPPLDNVFDAEIFNLNLDISAIKRIRVIFHHNGATGADAEVFVRMVTADSFG